MSLPYSAYNPHTVQICPLQPRSTVTNVEFYAGTNDLGRGFNLGLTSVSPSPIYANFVTARPITRLGNTYCLTWTNVPAGTFALTVVAKGAYGLTRTSPPVDINVLISPTNTNPADVVSITAVDPVAVAGTNAYVWFGVTNSTPSWSNWNTTVWQWFTNWGPKNALFTVKRFGDVRSNLTVNYHIGGTASNGVDYAPLPGYATIPAGSAYTVIPIVPVDNKVSSTAIKTVVLALEPATNKPPEYIVGYPFCAEAVIYEDWLRLPPRFLPDGSFHVTATGPDGAWFYVEQSSDMVNWTPTVSTGTRWCRGRSDFIDPNAANNASGFYRAVPTRTGLP